MSSRLKVGVLGSGPDAVEWQRVFVPHADLVRADSVAELLAAGVDLMLLFADPSQAERLAREVARVESAPPATLIVGGPGHPHTRLFRVLSEGKRDWERTFDAIVDPVALVDERGHVVRPNMGLARALGQAPKALMGVHYLELLGRGSPDPIAETLRDGTARTVEAQYQHLPGLRQVTTSPLAEEDAPARGLVVVLKDVTELKEQQERLLQAARLADIGQLAAGVAHEINTPLASIALRAESLLKSAEDARLLAIDAFRNFPRYLKTIDDEIFRCKKIIGALLEFSRARKAEVRPVDLNALAEKAADLVEHQMKLKQVRLLRHIDPALPAIQADEAQLRQALIALLMNALDAVAAGGSVEVCTRPEPDGMVSVTIADDGVGIAAEHMDKVFSPFFTTKPVGKGTGLGLAICHGIVSAHGGRIDLDSAPGKGTRVSLVLPVARPG